MRFRKKNKKEDEIDPVTKRLLEQGVIRINPPAGEMPDTFGNKVREFGTVTYDFWSGVKYIIILSALLWWLPLFGPMLAGYVGGRRTGGPKKGLFAAIVGLIVIAFGYFILTNSLMPSMVTDVTAVPASIIVAISEFDLIAPYAEFLQLYWSSFFTSVIGGLPYSPNSYIITAIFAYIGGVITVDKELEILRAEKKEAPTVDINLPWVITSQPANIPQQREMAPRRQAYASARRLQDMKKMQVSHYPPTRSAGNGGRSVNTPPDHVEKPSKRPVSRHTRLDGDDWELL